MPDLSEKRFESDIESYLLTEGGFLPGNQAYYHKDKAIDLSELIAFIHATQPKQWARYERNYPAPGQAEAKLYQRFQDEVTAKGLIHVLRNGVKDRGITLKFVYFKPPSDLNPDLVDKYNKNILVCHRQFAYSTENNNTIDMVLSVNGIPIVALELKNQFTNQSVEQGMQQYIRRDPRELLFQFNKRILVYFTADLNQVYMTTKLARQKTFFLPFNQGSGGAGEVGGAGNAPNPHGHPSSYLWEKVLERHNLLAMLQRYISLEKDKGNDRRKDKLLFPRYQQWDVVEKLTADVYAQGSGGNYLIQHSAGSGKSYSIAWLAYRLATLHDSQDEEIFHSVFVITDRRVLNSQLQETVTGFEHEAGMIVTITNKTPSSKLLEAIHDGRRIIMTTLHRFPVIQEQVRKQTGKRFAVIVDEAHSSQTGTSAQRLRETLADTEEALKELAEIEGKSEEELMDGEDLLVKQMVSQGRYPNMSFFGFTATPKPKTLEAFGKQMPDGKFRAFHIYSMRQAIEEGFIHDVLRNYTTIQNTFEIARKTKKNEELPEPPAVKAIRAYQHGHEDTINKKTAIIVEQFRQVTLSKLGGKAKAMVVTASRAHAVKYYLAIREYAKQKGYTDVNALVAFSGEITIGDTKYTEPMLNNQGGVHISEAQLPAYFAKDDYNLLVVAEKYQTGFDEPRLHTMFVDKGLKGVKAVQTLSRLNRTHEGKVDTFVLDFANTTESIRDSFLPFYEDTRLNEAIDPNQVYTLEDRVKGFHLFNEEDVERFVAVYLKPGPQSSAYMGKLAGILQPAVHIYNGFTEEKRMQARDAVRHFNRAYAYVVQIVRLFDRDLHRTYLYTEYLWRILPADPKEKVDLEGKIVLEKNRLEETFSGSIVLTPEEDDNVFPAPQPPTGNRTPDKKELLDNIIDKINLMYEGKFTDDDRVIIETIFDRMMEDNRRLRNFARNNDPEMFANSLFPPEFDKAAMDLYNKQMTSFEKLFKDKSFYNNVMEQMARVMYGRMRN